MMTMVTCLVLIHGDVLDLAYGYATCVGISFRMMRPLVILTFVHIQRLLKILQALIMHTQHVHEFFLLNLLHL